MKPFLLLLLTTLSCLGAIAQSHWETVVLPTDDWQFLIPSSDTPSNWYLLDFDDSNWNTGQAGFGYGDDDDATILPEGTVSVYLRRHFELYDAAALLQAILNIDYDDGFVAYLNGVEIARANLVGYPPLFDELASDHEAIVYQGGSYEYFTITPDLWSEIAIQGDNVLAIEVHNNDPASSDLSLIPFLSVAVQSPGITYHLPPDWFNAPAPMGFSSNLPIVIIETNGQAIMDEPRIVAQMGIIWNEATGINQSNDPFNHYNGKISVEYRGNSSQSFPKLSMGITTLNDDETDRDVSLLDMPEEHDWILYAPYTDKSMMRDALTYQLARNMGWYAARTQYVEVLVNGEYKGIYVLMEKIKRDKNRIDISKLNPEDTADDELTGGYILKTDHFAGNNGEPFYSPSGITIQYEYPRFDAITDVQKDYIQQYINQVENALFSDSFTDPNNGYRAYINIYSFIDAILLNELANNVDGYRLSSYYYKDKDSQCGKLTFSPLWDFNLTYGNADYCNGWETDVWQLYDGCADGLGTWFRRMLEDPYFVAVLRCRWANLRQNALHNNQIKGFIDQKTALLSQAIVRDSTQWQTIGNYIWPNYYIANSYQSEVDTLKWWLQNRLTWMDINMFGIGTPCNVAAPETIQISEINYHSAATWNTEDWIELHNYGTNSIDLSNWHVLDNNHLHQYCALPPNTILAPNDYLLLCTDTSQFIALYPTLANKVMPLCFALDNGGANLSLYNAAHQLAFACRYDDTAPFDTLPDGHGYTLERINGNNPMNPSAWASSCQLAGTPAMSFSNQLLVTLDNSNSTVCKYQNAVYQTTPIADATYYWEITEGNGSIISGQGTPTITVAWFGAGTSTLTVTVSTP